MRVNVSTFALLLLSASGLGATTISYTTSVTTGTVITDYTSGTTNWNVNENLQLDQFNPALGTLQSVTLDYEFRYTGNVVGGATGAMGSFSSGGPMYINGIEFAGNSGGQGASVAPGGTGSYRVSIFGTVTESATSTDSTTKAILAALTGAGSASYLWALADSSYLGGDDHSYNAVRLDSGSVNVTYNYTPAEAATPEPASLALAGLGLGAAVLLRRKRR